MSILLELGIWTATRVSGRGRLLGAAVLDQAPPARLPLLGRSGSPGGSCRPGRLAGGASGRLCSPVSRVTTTFWSERPTSDKVNLDIRWVRRESLENLDNQPAQEIPAREMVEDLAPLAEFEAVVALWTREVPRLSQPD